MSFRQRLYTTYGKSRLHFAAWVMLMTMVLLGLFMYYPMVSAVIMSFFRVITNEPRFVGIDNYVRAFRDELFLKGIRNTFYFMLLRIPVGMVISFLIALSLNAVRQRRYQSVLLSGFFLPYVTSVVAWTAVFLYLCHPQYGLFNSILSRLHLPTLYWFEDPKTAIPSLVFMDLWKYVGYSALLLFTGLQSIPSEYYEASRTDGANAWQRFWRITFPLMVPVTSMTAIILSIACIQIFSPMYMVYPANYGIGPSTSAASMAIVIYTNAFQRYDLNYASALSLILLVMILAITLASLRVSRITWEY